jgi:dual specificity tyrosine-phosphorylation-regulated kinase 2/3/4
MSQNCADTMDRVISNALPQSRTFPTLNEEAPAAPQRYYAKQQAQPAAADSSGMFDRPNFIPDVTFDDFANRLYQQEALSKFPSPPPSATLPSPPGPATHMASQPQAQPQPKQSGPASSVHATPTFTGSSLVRRFSQSRANPPPSAPEENTSIPPPQTNMAIRTRRQSQFPAQAPSNPAARAPRKSVGPGMFPTPTFDSRQASDNIRTRVGRTPSFGQGNRRGPLPANVSTGAEIPRMPNAARSTKAKSFHASSKQPQSMLTASMDSEQGGLPITQARSPIRPTVRTQTPSSTSSKRQSTIQHVSGLGARTISPTDARRLKRLSMNPNAVIQGAPRSPGTPQAEFSYDERVLDQSPAPVFRKSVTPSSARETPEQNRKSYASGISLSSNSSINSLRMANGTLQPRQGPAFLGSRLPTPKPRNVHSSTGGEEEEEEVPPVPAIPKAYESPKDPEHSRFSFATAAAKGAMANYTAEGVSSTEFEDLDTQGMETKKTAFPTQRESSIRHRRGLTVGAGSPADKSPAVASKKKNLQPIQLPPLNLLPLGSSFNNRMSSFPAPSAEVDVRHTTPPMQRASNKTPSTPMTASRASFFSNNNHQGQRDTNQLRTSSSAFNLRAGGAAEPTLHGASAMPIPTLNPPTRQMTTPFSSNSLPKNSGEFSQLRPRPSGEYHGHTDVELQNMKVQGPRALARKETADSVQTSTSTEPETPSSGGSSLRRKLSLSGWRRASSKAATHGPNVQTRSQTQKGEDQPPQPPKHSDMPPPRLPASATWTGGLGASPTPAKSSRPSLDFGRRKTSTTNIASDVEVDKNRSHKAHGSLTVRVPSAYAEPSSAQPTPKSGSSILTPMQRILGSKSSTNMLKARNLDSNLDKDDLVADEEMKKLASKRKDFEQAARDVDELRKRARPQERVSAAQALQMVNLNIFERGEIIDYKEIYFCGTKSAKKHVGDLNATTANFGYDDDRGDYNIVFGDHLAYRYEVVDMLGKGSFGQVVRCVDHKTGSLVAIKIIRNKKRFHQQALVEVNILKKLREWVSLVPLLAVHASLTIVQDPDNKHSMVNFTSSFYFRGHLCISTELLGMNLYEFIKAHEFKGFSLRLIRRFSKQMLSSLVCLKSHRVIHCDLKPENILLAHPLHSELKVIDFGSSCLDNEKVYTYIQSRFYRSPEVILGMSYGMPIDMWSLGCILAELLTGYPIFPGENEQEQLACIMEIFGPPEKHLIEKSSRKKLFFDSLGKPRVTVSTKGRRRRPSSKTLQQALKCDDDAFLDFIARCLRWDPERRMKPDEAMLHEFVTGVKRVARPRVQANTANTSSPVKRVPPSQTPSSRVRPLPEPPATSFKNTAAVNQNREISGSSPVKSGPRRLSTVQGAPGGIKRTAYGAPLNPGSGLPRVAQRSTSGRTDLASAAAVASLVSFSSQTREDS